MRPNKIREKINAGEQTVCTRIFNPTAPIVEVLGQAGLYDYVEFVAEYGSYDLHDLETVCRTAEMYGMGSMLKFDQAGQRYIAQRGVGAGFNALLFTDCRSAAEVEQCVRYVRPDTPEDGGLYGAIARRNAPIGEAGSPDYIQSLRDLVVCVMVEKRPAVEQLDQLLAVSGLDMVQWGGSDYSMSIGRPGERNHPDVLAAKKLVFTKAIEMGIPPRAEIASPDEAKEYLDMGVRHFSIGSDVGILHQWWRNTAEQLRKVIG